MTPKINFLCKCKTRRGCKNKKQNREYPVGTASTRERERVGGHPIRITMMAHHQQQQQPYDPYYPHQPHPQPEPGYVTVFNDRNAISTVFVSGLPDDVKAREIHNLFRRRPGFDYCQLKYTGRGNQVPSLFPYISSSFSFSFSLIPLQITPQQLNSIQFNVLILNSRVLRFYLFIYLLSVTFLPFLTPTSCCG